MSIIKFMCSLAWQSNYYYYSLFQFIYNNYFNQLNTFFFLKMLFYSVQSDVR